MSILPKRLWVPGGVDADGRQLWYSTERSESERLRSEQHYLRELRERQEQK
jgi:hypothetical protein